MAVERLTDYTRRIWTGLGPDSPVGHDIHVNDVIYYMDSSECCIVTNVHPDGSIDCETLPDIGGGGGAQWELIGTKTLELEEYTNTSTAQTISTDIRINASVDYAFILVIITCDTPVTTDTEWGTSVAICGRFKSSYNISATSDQVVQTKGTAELSLSAIPSNTFHGAYGVTLANNYSQISIIRKANGSVVPKIRGGTYTVKAYGLKNV